MYKVLLVDDERLVLKSLEGGVDWQKFGFKIIGTANNGSSALRKVEELRPHVVFTDIKMPDISGLELMKKIRETDKRIQFIVISGHAEFAYAQKSLNYGALGYCLKPFDDYEINLLLKKAHDILDEISQKNETRLLELIEEQSDEESAIAFNEILREAGITSKTLHILVAVGKGRLKFPENVKFLRLKLGTAKNAYFVQYQNINADDKLILGEIPEGILGIGVCKSSSNLDNLVEGLEVATAGAWGFFIYGKKGFFNPLDADSNGKGNELIEKLEKAIADKNIELIDNLLTQMCGFADEGCIGIVHALRIYNLIYFYIMFADAGACKNDYIFSNEQLYDLFSNFQAMIEYLKTLLKNQKECTGVPIESELNSDRLKEIVQYVNSYYCSNISIQSISKEFFINPNYLSQLFKKELKLTFTEYLTKLRLNQAKTLLETTGLSIGEIAECVGFNDYFYFIRSFKKATKQSPGQYRIKYRQRKF